MVHIIGYNAELPETLSSRFRATAIIDGIEVSHTLSPVIKPHRPIDVGRSQDGDLIWVTEMESDVSVFAQSHYDPPVIPYEAQVVAPVFEPSLAKKILALLSQRKQVLLFAVGVFGFCVVSVSVFPFTESRSTLPPAVSKTTPAVTTELPEQAAINFVKSGQVEGFSVLEEDPNAELTAHVVSQSGEIVLVEISALKDSGETTFATLLLQRAGSAWRIRQVFDVVN